MGKIYNKKEKNKSMGIDNKKEKIIKELLKLEGGMILEMRKDFEEEKIREILRNRTTECLDKTLKKEEKQKIKIMLRNLAISEYTLNKNYQELLNMIKVYYQEFNGWAAENALEIQLFLIEICRLLHNYLSSVYSLSQHTEFFRKIIDNKEFNEEYEKKLKKLENEELKCFLVRLRAYIQHHRSYSPTAYIEYRTKHHEKGKGVEQYLFFDKKKLIDFDKRDLPGWNRWGSKAKNYIEKCGDRIELEAVIEKYQGTTRKFYDHFYKKVIELYSKKYPEMEKEILTLEKIRSVE